MSDRTSEPRRPKIAADAPVFKAVAMLPSMSEPMVPLRSTPMLSAKYDVQSNVLLSSDYSKQLNKENPWMVTEALAIPSYYQLERTHVFVPNATANEVSERIGEFLRMESIAASFDNEQAIARAETSHCLKFAIRLWKVRGTICVEVQRTSGCCFLYQQTAKAVIRAAVSSTAVAIPKMSLPMPRTVPHISDVMWEQCTSDDLENVCSSLHEDNRMDAHVMAAEALVQLSEASQCRIFCANKILSSNCELLSTLLMLVQCSQTKEKEIKREAHFKMEETHFALMHRHALTVLANCLSAIHESGELENRLKDLSELTSASTVKALVKDVSLAHKNPHEATTACRCLHALCSHSEECKAMVICEGGMSAASVAKQCRHALLESEATKLLQEL